MMLRPAEAGFSGVMPGWPRMRFPAVGASNGGSVYGAVACQNFTTGFSCRYGLPLRDDSETARYSGALFRQDSALLMLLRARRWRGVAAGGSCRPSSFRSASLNTSKVRSFHGSSWRNSRDAPLKVREKVLRRACRFCGSQCLE